MKDIRTHARNLSSKGNGIDKHSAGTTVRNMRQKWLWKFIDKDVPEPEESINHILASLLQFKNVMW